VNKIAFALLFVATTASAQDAPKPEAPPAPTETKAAPAPPKFKIELEQGDIATLNQCIGELPYKVAQPFVTKLNIQINPQVPKP
jgi:hypothetical protein